MNFLLFREKKADVGAPVFLTENAVESAHSKLFTLKPISSISQQITRMWRKDTIKIGSEGQHIQNTLLIKQYLVFYIGRDRKSFLIYSVYISVTILQLDRSVLHIITYSSFIHTMMHRRV